MQEDKEATFDAANAFALIIAAMTGMIDDMTVNEGSMTASTQNGFITATDLADWLVRVLNMPFRRAHHVTGTLVALAEDKGCDLDGLTLAEMQGVEPEITQDVFTVLTVESSVASRTSFGGTAPDQVRAQVKAAQKRIE
jgi:argininosuccinate lyase